MKELREEEEDKKYGNLKIIKHISNKNDEQLERIKDQ